MPVSIDQIVVQLTTHMSDEQKLAYIVRFTKERRNPNTALLLCLFLGCVGAHHYYMGRVGKGILCTLFAWTLVPFVLSLFACRKIRTNVQRHNFAKAVELAATYCPGLTGGLRRRCIDPELAFPNPEVGARRGAGYVVMLVAQLGGDTALTAVAPAIMPQPGEAPSRRTSVSGWVRASHRHGWLRVCAACGRSEMKQALSVGAALDRRRHSRGVRLFRRATAMELHWDHVSVDSRSAGGRVLPVAATGILQRRG